MNYNRPVHSSYCWNINFAVHIDNTILSKPSKRSVLKCLGCLVTLVVMHVGVKINLHEQIFSQGGHLLLVADLKSGSTVREIGISPNSLKKWAFLISLLK